MAPSHRQVRHDNTHNNGEGFRYAVLDGPGAGAAEGPTTEVVKANAAAAVPTSAAAAGAGGGGGGGGVPGIVGEVTSNLGFVVTLLDGQGQVGTTAAATTAKVDTTTTSAKDTSATAKASTTSSTTHSTTTSTSTSSSSSSTTPSTSPTSTASSTSTTSAPRAGTASKTSPKATTSTMTLTQFDGSTTGSATSVSSSTNAADSQSGAAAAGTVKLSQPAMIGIIVGSVVVGLFIILFILRKVCLARRKRSRLAWDEGLSPYTNATLAAPTPVEKVEQEVGRRMNASVVPLGGGVQKPLPPISAPQLVAPPAAAQSYAPQQYAPQQYAPPQPPAAYRPAPINTSMSGPYPTFGAAGAGAGAGAAASKRLSSIRYPAGPPSASIYAPSPPPPAAAPPASLTPSNPQLIKPVLTTYTPQLPDELPLSVGEKVRVVEVFEDGWAMVERVGGGEGAGGGAGGRERERGVVPVECLGMGMGMGR